MFYLFTLAILDHHCCSDLSLAVESRGYSLAEVCRLLNVMVPLVAEHWALGQVDFSSCGIWVALTRLLWLLGSGTDSVALVQQLNCSMACRMFPERLNPYTPASVGGFLNHH